VTTPVRSPTPPPIKAEEEAEEEDFDEEELLADFQKFGFATTPSKQQPPETASHVSFVPPQTTMQESWPSSSPPRVFRPVSSTGTPSSTSASASDDNCPGSRTNPRTLMVDVVHLERNDVFDIEGVPRMEKGGWARAGYHIRTQIGLDDIDAWSAFMDPEMPDRAIVVRGRSRSSACNASLESCHRDSFSADAKSKHLKTREDIQKDPSRLTTYYRIIFDTDLDNVILSGDGVEVSKHSVGVKHMAGQDKDVECLAMFAHWEVALKGVGHKLEAETKKNLKDAFN
jgi:hypothetical protein